MPLALLLITLAGTGTGSASPLRPELYETHLASAPGMLVPELAGSRGGEIYGGVRQIVSGSILLGVGLAIGAGGLYSLISAGAETGSARTVFTALGWTFFGIGALLAVVGIPLLIVGIVRVSNRPGQLALGIDQHGQLAVRF
jgi:hypothetical protein